MKESFYSVNSGLGRRRFHHAVEMVFSHANDDAVQQFDTRLLLMVSCSTQRHQIRICIQRCSNILIFCEIDGYVVSTALRMDEERNLQALPYGIGEGILPT
ncbi:hypothetical protein M9H77_11374 [Catharanthus roseus]|uniref:Uncharacterized protein n=1 Tax=Catharanthus roseus TaxID=4058 RepID=A0ACC0BEG1_CATRO|nr:hypothetical protein M9H77_11374 [Catharanthus roseus]